MASPWLPWITSLVPDAVRGKYLAMDAGCVNLASFGCFLLAASCLAADSSEFPVAVRVAAAYCGRAYRWVATENIQVHGGIGFTWEHDAHLHYRRSWASETLLGSTDEHALAIADRLGL